VKIAQMVFYFVLSHETAICEGLGAEVEEETEFLPGCSEVVHHLRLLGDAGVSDGLDLDDYGVEAKKVGPVCGAQPALLVGDRKGDFSTEGDVSFGEFKRKGLMVDLFQKATAEMAVNLHRSADECVRPGISYVGGSGWAGGHVTQITQMIHYFAW